MKNINIIILLSSFVLFTQSDAAEPKRCRQRDVRVKVKGHCDAYFECEDYVRTQKLCGDGMIFNEEAELNEAACRLPTPLFQCVGKSQTPQPTKDCPRQYGQFPGKTSNCGKYIQCVAGVAKNQECHPRNTLAFNPKMFVCDWPDQVPQCDTSAYFNFTCPEVDEDDDRGGYLTYPNPTNPRRFFHCIDNIPRPIDCGKGHVYEDETQSCIPVATIDF